VTRNELSPHADIEAATTLIYSFNLYHLLTDQLDDDAVIKHYVRMIVGGLKRNPVLSRHGDGRAADLPLIAGKRRHDAPPKARQRRR